MATVAAVSLAVHGSAMGQDVGRMIVLPRILVERGLLNEGVPVAVPVNPSSKMILVDIDVDKVQEITKSDETTALSLANVLPKKLATVHPGETLDGLVRKLYSVDYSQPGLKRGIEDSILRINSLSDARSLPVGTIGVPIVPFVVAEGQRASKAMLAIDTQGSREGISGIVRVGTNFKVASAVRTIMAKSSNAPVRRTQVWMDEASASKLRADPTIGSATSFSAAPFEVVLADAPESTGASTSKVFEDAERTATGDMLKASMRQPTFVFIFDTGWPSSADQQSSINQLNSIMDFVWQDAFSKAGSALSRSVPLFVAPSQKHCVEIAQALEPFRSIDGDKAVKVIFVPMSQEQGSRGTLIELIQLGMLVQYMQGGRDLLQPVGDEEIQKALDDATRVVDSLPATWPSDTVDSNTGLVGFPLRVFNYYCGKFHTRFFVNQSWTVRHENFPLYVPTPLFGRLVTAAGNDANTDVLKPPYVDFVSRSATCAETVGVLNVSRDKGLSPNSSRANDAVVEDSQIVGFDGYLDSTETATSFAAPRVSWILAAMESTQVQDDDAILWSKNFKQRLLSSRVRVAGSYWLDPSKYLSLGVPGHN